jgi:hypothetical protein
MASVHYKFIKMPVIISSWALRLSVVGRGNSEFTVLCEKMANMASACAMIIFAARGAYQARATQR